MSGERSAISPLAYVAREYRRERGRRPSEFRSALRTGISNLYDTIDEALKRVQDPETVAHLKDLRAELRRVP